MSRHSNNRQEVQRSNEDLQYYLQVNHLLDEVEDSLLIDNFDKICHSLGEELDILRFIVKYSNAEKLKPMQECIKSIQRDNDKSNKDLQDIENINNSEHKEEMKDIESMDNEEQIISFFSHISTNSIENICQFLQTYDIRRFKTVCCRIGVICLKEMNKCLIKVLNGKKLIGLDINAIDIRYINLMTKYRQSPHKQFGSLFIDWYDIHGIKEEQQLLFSVTYRNGIQKMQQMNTNQIRHFSIGQQSIRSFVLIHKKSTVILDQQYARIASKNDNYNTLKHYHFRILQYFDIQLQKLKIIQFLLISPDTQFVDIVDYIENYFIHTNNDRIWYKELKLILNRMFDDRTSSKLRLNQCIDLSDKKSNTPSIYLNSFINNSNSVDNILTFSINYKHNWCKQEHNIFFLGFRWEKERKLQVWHRNFESFYRNCISFNISYAGNTKKLKKNIRKYWDEYDDELSLSEKYNLSQMLENVNTFSEHNNIYISSQSQWGALQHEIAERVSFFKPNEIELTTNRYSQIKPQWNRRICTQEISLNKTHSITFNIVPYNTQSVNIARNHTTINIKIYKFDNIPPLREYLDTSPARKYCIKVQYHKKYKLKHLIYYLKHCIEEMNVIKSMEYKSLISVLNNNNNFDFLLYGNRNIYGSKHYTINDTVDELHENVSIYVFPRRIISNDRSTTLFLIRFAKASKINGNKDIWKIGFWKTFCCFPAIFWINNTDTLENVIDNHFSDIKPHIAGTYGVYPSSKTVTCISSNNRSWYRLYNMKDKYPSSFITISLRGTGLNL